MNLRPQSHNYIMITMQIKIIAHLNNIQRDVMFTHRTIIEQYAAYSNA